MMHAVVSSLGPFHLLYCKKVSPSTVFYLVFRLLPKDICLIVYYFYSLCVKLCSIRSDSTLISLISTLGYSSFVNELVLSASETR